MPRNTCKKVFWFSFNSKRPQIWDSVSNYHLDGLNKLTRLISVQESAISLFISLCFSVYVNSATFSSSVEMAPKFTFRFIIPKYRGLQNRIFEIPLRDCIFKARVFSSFFKPYFCTGLLSQPNPIFVPQKQSHKVFRSSSDRRQIENENFPHCPWGLKMPTFAFWI